MRMSLRSDSRQQCSPGSCMEVTTKRPSGLNLAARCEPFHASISGAVRAAASPQDFTRLCTDMIEHALASPAWDPRVNRTYDLDGMVFQLLGFDSPHE